MSFLCISWVDVLLPELSWLPTHKKVACFWGAVPKKVSVNLDADLFACVVKTPSTAGRWLICSTLVSDCRTSK